MSWSVFIRKGKVYLPTAAITSDGIIVGISPVEVVSIDETDAVASAVERTLRRGQLKIPALTREELEASPTLEAAGVKKWSQFYRGAKQMGFMISKSGFEIFRLVPYRHGGYVVDEDSRVILDKEMPTEEVAARIGSEIQRLWRS